MGSHILSRYGTPAKVGGAVRHAGEHRGSGHRCPSGGTAAGRRLGRPRAARHHRDRAGAGFPARRAHRVPRAHPGRPDRRRGRVPRSPRFASRTRTRACPRAQGHPRSVPLVRPRRDLAGVRGRYHRWAPARGGAGGGDPRPGRDARAGAARAQRAGAGAGLALLPRHGGADPRVVRPARGPEHRGGLGAPGERPGQDRGAPPRAACRPPAGSRLVPPAGRSLLPLRTSHARHLPPGATAMPWPQGRGSCPAPRASRGSGCR